MTTIPYLTADDMCHRHYQRGDRYCLSGHCDRVFGKCGDDTWAARKKIAASLGMPWPFSIPGYNDAHTLQENADVWNRAFGLTEPSQ